jgi:molybdopterin/thiamine biosynthesis adenylyltransferase
VTTIDEATCARPGPEGPGASAPPLGSFVDHRSGLRIEVHDPLARPDRWLAYLDGANARYLAHDVTGALGRPSPYGRAPATLVYVAVDADDRVVGGLRCHGPLRHPADAYALGELDGHPRLDDVRALLAQRAADGVVEVKGVWIDAGLGDSGLADVLARCYVHAMEWFGASWAMCSAAVERTGRWSSTGGRAQEGLAPIAYPDDRYRTVLMWWDAAESERRSTPAQWSLLVAERAALGVTPAPSRRSAPAPRTSPAITGAAWRGEVLAPSVPVDAARIAELMADPATEVLDRLAEQHAGLRTVVPGPGTALLDEDAVWVHYPWRRTLVRLLGPTSFRALRLDRNRNKITSEEQDLLGRQKVGVVGLSVGHSIAFVLAQEGVCAELRLADFDTLEVSNLNRIPATVLDLGLNKATILSRRIAELDPYVRIEHVPDGLTAANIDAFVDGLDVIVEECDSLDLKLLVREAARTAGIPVLMETSDRGLFDVERFDLEPDRPAFHGLLGDVGSDDLAGLTTADKVPHVLRLLEAGELSSRMAASMAEIDETLTTWPQLGGDVSLGAATVAAAVRRLGRGEHLPSGRVRIDMAVHLDALASPEAAASVLVAPVPVTGPPSDPALAVADAANLAPSGGNAQPWSLRLDGHGLRIVLDRSRSTAMDVDFRGSLVAIGAAALNARIAAAAHGMLGRLVVHPEGEGSDVVAELRFGRSADVALASRYPAVLDRTTNRRAGTPAELAPALVRELHDEVEREGACLHLIDAPDDLEAYAELLAESDRLRYLSPVLHREMIGELRWPGRDQMATGIDVRTLELDDADLAKLDVARRADVMADLASWDGGRALGTVTRDRVRSSSALALVTVTGTRPAAYVAGGMAVQRLWLAAEVAGLAVQPVSPLSVFAVEDADFTALVPAPYVLRLQELAGRLRTLAGLADGEQLALVLRLSHAGPPTVRSRRLALDEVLLGR